MPLKTPLHQYHLDHSAHMVDFAGWDMPLYYSGITQEHHQVRTSGGLFDVSHMGRVKVSGRHSRKFLDRLCSRRILDMEPGQCRYALVCNDKGGVKDDVIVYRVDDDDFTVVVNASNREKLLGHFESVRAANDMVVKIEDQTMSTAMVALQGPKVMDMIAKFSSEIPRLKKYRFAVKNLLVIKIVVSRTGYTGEDGVEAILPSAAVGMAMKMLLQQDDKPGADAVVKPAGLGARDTLRMEAGMPLYGHELGEDICALACGVDFAIALDKVGDERTGPFVGADALVKIRDAGGPPRLMTGLTIEGKRSARQGMRILRAGREVGVVTSGCPSPTLGVSIAMGFVDRDSRDVGAALEVDTGKGTLPAKVVTLPFYKAPKPA
jgi:aminomethyltransferase